MSFEVIHSEKENGTMKQELRRRKLRHCLEMCIKLKDGKILVVAYGIFIISLAMVLTVGHYAIQKTTTSTIHTESSIPTLVTSVLVFLSGVLFTSSIVVKNRRCLIIITIILATSSGIFSAIGAVHYGITVSNRLTALSDCTYNSFERRCACSVVTSSSQVKYTFEETMSCDIITKHLREVAYGMFGVYGVAFVSCFGAAVYVILLAHKAEIQKIKNAQRQERAVAEKAREQLVKEKQSLEDDAIAEDRKKDVLPWQQDVATQTTSRSSGNDASCRRHFVEVTVPDASNDFVVNITKSRDPPPPYCETVYT